MKDLYDITDLNTLALENNIPATGNQIQSIKNRLTLNGYLGKTIFAKQELLNALQTECGDRQTAQSSQLMPNV